MFDSRDVGHRVVIRRIVGERDGRPLFSDALGRLMEVNDVGFVVRTTKGTVDIPRGQVYRAKRVPDQRRPHRREIAALELVANEGWPAPVTDRLGQWWLRAAEGWTGRANSALPIGDPGMPIAEAIDEVVRWYHERGQHPMINVPLPYAAPLDAELAARGWQYRPTTLVLTTLLADLIDAIGGTSDLPPVRLGRAPTTDWLEMVEDRKKGLPGSARHILTSVDQLRFAEVRADDGELLAIGRGAVTATWLGISLLEVVTEARRRGLARHVIGAVARWAESIGAQRVYLQVEEGNTAAVTLYRSLGFTTHHHYLTRYAP